MDLNYPLGFRNILEVLVQVKHRGYVLSRPSRLIGIGSVSRILNILMLSCEQGLGVLANLLWLAMLLKLPMRNKPVFQ